MKIIISRKLLIFSLIILACNGYIGYAVYESNQNLHESEQWVLHSEQVIFQTGNIFALGKDIETASMGFVISNDSTFLESLMRAEKTTFSNIRQLRKLTRDNPVQQQLVDSLDFYINKYLEYSFLSSKSISKPGLVSDLAFVYIKRGKQYADRINMITISIQEEEAKLLKKRNHINSLSVANFSRFSLIMFILIMGFTVLLLIVLSINLLQNKEKEKREAELIIANEELVFQNKEKEKRAAELIIAKEKAEESDNLKTAFLRNMSHEIRTPLSAIIGFSALLNDENNSKDDIREFTTLISQSGKRLIETVNNVIDIAKIQTGQVEIKKKPIFVYSIFSDLFTFFYPLANTKNIRLNYHNHGSGFIMIFSDEAKLYQILTNLLNNAIKFSESGDIDFGYEVKDDVIQFYVKDTGIGIHPDLYETIFDRFIQAEQSFSRGYEGAGLGLAICKGLVGLLGGKISVESEVNKGTTFFFTLPYKHLSLIS